MNNHSKITWMVIFIVVYIVFALALSDLVPNASWQLWVTWALISALSIFVIWRI